MHKALLLFGATGDLAARQLFPALAWLLKDRLLPADFRIVASARQAQDAGEFTRWLRERIEKEPSAAELGADDIIALLERIDYVAADGSRPDDIARAFATYADRPCVSYLATPPSLFESITAGLKAAGVLESPSRLVLEKPIGSDLGSARAINAAIGARIDEDRVYRIDHYLGKAPVQNVLAMRFGNTLLEAVWDKRWIESVDILVAETSGVNDRLGYYGQYGALRDMVQNHILQLLCLIAMEPPASLDADALRSEKVKVLRALRPMTADAIASSAVRGRYEAGVVGGRAVDRLVADDGSVPDIETFVALEAHIDNWRWAGVPFRLTTGKRLAERCSQVVVNFRPVSHWLFEKPSRARAEPNRLTIRLQPHETIQLELMGSLAGPDWGALELQPLPLDLSMPRSQRRRIAYERLLLDALNGSPTLFVRSDEVEAAWTWIDSVVAAWRIAALPILPYPAGSWGPADAARFLPETIACGGEHPRGRR
jgi:glucose-6-phosphate 1-dehydrogenase